tara:strand:- start:400 stop:1008 length:609 start_codon:yes stop_codon:yes gene_type:complete
MSEMAKAFAAFQKENSGLAADKQGQRSKYSSVGSIMTKVKMAAAHGLSVSQVIDRDEHGAFLKTIVMHTSGEQPIIGKYPLIVQDPTNSQQMGSAVSYARRYALMAALGLATGIQELDDDDDDDGEANGLLDDPPREMSLAELEAKCLEFKTLVSLNAWINKINPLLHKMADEKMSDYNRFYAVWKQHEQNLAEPPIEKGDK